LLFHHAPLALVSAVVLVVFMTLPLFDASGGPTVDMRSSSAFPQQRGGSEGMDEGDHGGDRTEQMDMGGDQTTRTGDGGGSRHEVAGIDLSQLTVATGYVATGLLGLTLLIGPASLLLRRRNPVSSYLRRDVGTWTVIVSLVHVLFGLQLHGTGQLSGFLAYFVAADGSPLTNSFGLGNWTGLAATVIAVGLLALSSDFALRKLKAKTWKDLQRLNYTLFALVVLHAFFYGALLRTTSPFTLLLGLIVFSVFVGQAAGIWWWRRRSTRSAAGQTA
jgi:sulfoxide reductase heme-binding subunit YedZ